MNIFPNIHQPGQARIHLFLGTSVSQSTSLKRHHPLGQISLKVYYEKMCTACKEHPNSSAFSNQESTGIKDLMLFELRNVL